MILVTNRGATELLSIALRRESGIDWDGILFAHLLNDVPPIDRTIDDLASYPTQEDVTVDPDELTPDGWGTVSIVEEKATIQYGPPSVKFTCPTAFTCYGHLVCDGEQQVYWLERYETPIEIAADGLLQVAIAFALWGACPPLPPGCS